jgi:two-component system, NarL family, sensor histidine kinase UhpB
MNRLFFDPPAGSALLLLAAVVSLAVAYARPGPADALEATRVGSAPEAGRSPARLSHLFWQGLLLVALAVLAALAQGAHKLVCLALVGVASWAGIQTVLRLARRRWSWVDVLLPAQTLLIVLLARWLAPTHWPSLLLVCGFLFAAQWIAALGLLLQRRRMAAPGWPAAWALAVLGVGAAILQALPWPAPAAQTSAGWSAVLVWGLPFVIALLALLVAWRSTQSSRAEQEATPSLIEQRVREVTADLELSYRQLADQKVQQVTERERKRIAADLHDDLGAKLLTIVHTSDSERISSLAREALEEMRLSVRGLTGRPVQLADALGDWRAETVMRLAQAGIDSDWHAPEDLPQMLSSRAYVQTTRILRESTSNIIKHSGASHCSVRVAIEEGDFQLVIQDDGNGITEEVDARLDRGHGLASMKNRAKQLQGQCLIESGAGYGTVIRLTLPLDTALGAA